MMNLCDDELVINKNYLFEYCLNLKKPVYENILIKEIFNDNHKSGNGISLFKKHFLLFNALYELKRDYYHKGYMVYIEPMNIVIREYPENGQCYHYDIEHDKFCKNSVYMNSNYCKFHYEYYGIAKNSLLSNVLSDFYLDKSNIEFEYSTKFKKYFKSFNKFLKNRKQIDKALKFFAIDLESANKENISKKYKKLVKKYHPDKQYYDQNKIKIINMHYEVLKEVFF